MADRKAELERKKAKLQAMRDEKKRKEEERRKKGSQADTPSTPYAASPDLRAEPDQILQDLGITPATTTSAAAPASANDDTPRPSPICPEFVPEGGDKTASPIRTIAAARRVQLSASKVTQTSIAPKEVVAYSKETQTPTEPVDRDGSSPQHHPYGSPKFDYPNLEWDEEFSPPESGDDDTDSLDVGVDTPPISAHLTMPHVEMTPPAGREQEAQQEEEQVAELTEEEVLRIMNREDFGSFIEKSTRVVERALADPVDLFTDYSGGDTEDQEGGTTEGEKLKLNRQFFDEKWSKNRLNTCLDWSTQYPELLLASYNSLDGALNEPDGTVLIWNMKYKKTTPEYIFHCQSPVLSCCFAKFHPNLVIGGTYSGRIALWDNRANRRTPVQRSPLSAQAHTHPLYCLNVVGTQNAHNLISVSTDGKMCSWSLDMLSQPQDSMELQHKQAKSVAVTAMSFLSGDVNNFVVGCEDCTVYTACRHGSKAGISEQFEGHSAPLTGIDCHSAPGPVDFSRYFITSSMDWTAKLWNVKENKPLHSFDFNNNYAFDCRWSPVHPALFALVDIAGRLDLWNLNSDTEVPTASTVIDCDVPLNKCRWHQTGTQIAAGDEIGRIHVYDVGETLALPKNDEWSRFVRTLQDLKDKQVEQEADKNNTLQ